MTEQAYKLPEHMVILSRADLFGNIIDYNEGFKEASGYTDMELLNRSHNLLRHPDMPQEAFQDLWCTIKDGRPWFGIVKNRRKQGDYYWVASHVAPIIEQGKIVNYVSIRYPATSEQIAQAEQLHQAVKQGKIPYPRTKKPGVMRKASIISASLLLFSLLVILATTSSLAAVWIWIMLASAGMATSYLTYQTLTLLRPSEAQQLGIASLVNGQFKHPITGDEPWTCALNMIRLRIGEAAARQYDAVAHALELKTQAEKLALDMTLDLRQKTDEALAAVKVKSAFLANMSHEIRTPINAVLGLSFLALKQNPPATYSAYFSKIHYASESLLTIVNQILDFSKIEAGEMLIETASIDIERLMRDSLAMVIAASPTAHLQIHQTIDPVCICKETQLIGDEFRVKQILINLLSNAVKFTPEGSVTLHVECLANTEERADIAFHVIDTGIGIAKDKQEIIFHAFAQEDGSITRDYGGTGLGLSISNHLAKLMGGHLTLVSEQGKGSCFTLNLVLNKQRIEHASIAQGQRIPLARETMSIIPNFSDKVILLVEDNLINQQITQEMLAPTQVKIIVAGQGQEALDILHTAAYDFDAILMDLQMPVMGGIAATVQIRAQEAFRDIPIIAITAHTFEEEKRECFAAGMNDHLAKPIRQEALYACLYYWLIQHIAGDSEQALATIDDMPASDPYKSDADDLSDPRSLQLASIPNFDIETALMLFPGSQDKLIDLLLQLHRDYHDAITRVRALVAREDYEAAILLTHTMKGLFGHFAMPEITRVFAACNKALKQQQWQDDLLPAAFEKQYQQTMNAIKALEMHGER
jgi:PAS domain S-box-containing protein